MMQDNSEHWDLVYTVYLNGIYRQSLLWDVVAGQQLYIEWDGAPTGVTTNNNGWVLNGNGCCEDIKRLSDIGVGVRGNRTVTVTQSGQVRVAGYSTANAFTLVEGSVVKIRIL